MKKMLTLLAASASLFACEKQVEAPKPQAKAASSNVEDTYQKPRIRFKHGIGCAKELGICIIAPFKQAAEDTDIYGTSYTRLEGNKLHIILEQPAATSEGVVPISKDIVVFDWLGYKTVTVKAGDYKPSYARYEFGEIWADVELK